VEGNDRQREKSKRGIRSEKRSGSPGGRDKKKIAKKFRVWGDYSRKKGGTGMYRFGGFSLGERTPRLDKKKVCFRKKAKSGELTWKKKKNSAGPKKGRAFFHVRKGNRSHKRKRKEHDREGGSHRVSKKAAE